MNRKQTKHARVMRILRGRIANGVYPGKLPGEKALADELNVDPKSVQIALAQLEGFGMVRREWRKGTFAVPPGRTSQKLFARLLMPYPFIDTGEMSFWAFAVVYGFQQAACRHGMSMVTEYAGGPDTLIQDAVRGSEVSGCVGTCVLATDLTTRELLALSDTDTPVVIADQVPAEAVVPSVAFDNYGAGRLSAAHLVGLGHTRVGVLWCAQRTPQPARDRLRGALACLEKAGVRAVTRYCYNTGESAPTLRALLADPAGPTAVICMETSQAELLIELAEKVEREVPGQLSVVTFGESRIIRNHHITMAHMDHIALGEAALAAILDEDLIDNPRAVLLPVKMSPGATAGAPPA